jgi:uncharacterized protein (TIGR02271 family)
VRREEVTIERHPVNAAAVGDVAIGEDEIRVPVMREEVVAEKRVVPTEEVVVRKHAVTEERVVEDDVRRERAVVDDSQVRGQVHDQARDDARLNANPPARARPDASNRPL